MSAETEPRRSVRATKGQHTKSFDQLDQAAELSVRRGKKSKKAKAEEPEPEEEIIRCVCGATEQDEDSGEPWIACDSCGAWQHNVCMGMSVFADELPKNYYCERCRPENHKELIEGVARGEKPWEPRRQAYQEAEAEKKKKKGRRGRGKRTSDQKEKDKDKVRDKEKPSGEEAASMSRTPPAQEAKREKDKKEGSQKPASVGKRKARDEAPDTVDHDGPAPKLQKVSDTKAVPSGYQPPADLPAKLSDLPDNRQGPAKLLIKAMNAALSTAAKKGVFVPGEGETIESKAEQLAFQTERAVFDSHPDHKGYASQCRTISFNVKSNEDLCSGLLSKTLSPTALAVMTSAELANKELQRETAEMKARVEKQSILINDEGPRVRRTHKGEEFIEDDSVVPSEEAPTFIRRPSNRETTGAADALAAASGKETGTAPAGEGPGAPLKLDTRQEAQRSPSQGEFDINKVLSSVKSPTGPAIGAQGRRPSAPAPPAGGAGVDPDIDRLLQDENESPPYSPTDESDPDIVWRGTLVMNTIGHMPATMKHVGGANLATVNVMPWTTMVPRWLSVAGRIDQNKAIEYLCGLRYVADTDVVVTSLSPASAAYKSEFDGIYQYFVSKQRYGVIGEKGVGNVRDTYVVPVEPGEGNLPEFMYNLVDNFIPDKRTEPMLLVVFVFKDESSIKGPTASQAVSTAASLPQRNTSVSGPAFSPTSPQGAFPSPGLATPGPTPATGTPQPPTARVYQTTAGAPTNAQQPKEQILAAEVLGPLISCPSVRFLLPQAGGMSRSEWEVIKEVLSSEPRARDDLRYLSTVLEKAPNMGRGPQPTASTPQPPAPAPHNPAAAAPAV